MDRSLLTLIIALGLGIILSFPAVRRSIKKEKIRGGTAAQLFHHLGVVTYIAVLPSALCGSFLVGPWVFGIPLALTFLLLTAFNMIMFAVAERPARIGLAEEDRGWTEEDARSSGM